MDEDLHYNNEKEVVNEVEVFLPLFRLRWYEEEREREREENHDIMVCAEICAR